MGRRQPEAGLPLPQSVATVLRDQITLELERRDRLDLTVYVPPLQQEWGVVGCFRRHRGQPIASSAWMEPRTTAFVTALERVATQQGVPLIPFPKGQRKDDLALARLAIFPQDEGVVCIGKAQEKASVCRTERRHHPETGRTCPWRVRASALVNQ